MTRDEIRVLAFIAFLLALSALVRIAARPDDAALLAEDADLELLEERSQASLDDEEARSRPLAEGELVDPNRAAAAELDRLPGVGPATAARIVAARDSTPFVRAEDLLRVRGLGPATLEKARAHLDPAAFPGSGAGGARPGGAGPGGSTPFASASGSGLRDTPRASGPGGLVDVNRAGPEELATLSGIGPALAARIVAHRDSAGPFRSPEDLLAVRGIGPATLERIRPRLAPP